MSRHRAARVALLIPAAGVAVWAISAQRKPRNASPALTPAAFIPLTLTDTRRITPSVQQLTFALAAAPPAPVHVPHAVWVKDDTMQIARPYTPISDASDSPHKLVVAIRDYPGKGQMSSMLCRKRVGDVLEWRGPVPSSSWSLEVSPANQSLLLIAGGTGITPMYQIIRAALCDRGSTRRIRLLYANRSADDVLLRRELDELAAQHPQRLQITYFIEQSAPAATPSVIPGQISADVLRNEAAVISPPTAIPSSSPYILVCGPDGLMRHVCGTKPTDHHQGPVTGILGALGYSSTDVHKL